MQIQNHGEVDWKVWFLVSIFSPVPIALFFFISGLFSRRIVDAPWGANLTLRLVGLTYAFVVWSLIDITIAYLLVGEVRVAKSAWAYVLDPKSALWFIWGLIIFTALANLVWRRWRTATLCVALVVSVFSFAIPTSSFVYENLIRFFPFFLIGLSGASIPKRILAHRIKIFAAASLVYGGLIFFYVRLDGTSAGAELIWFTAAWVALPLSIAASSLAADIPLVGSLVERLGRASLPIYLAHETVLRLLMAAGLAVIGTVEGPQIISVFVTTAAVIAVTAAFAELSVKGGLTALYRPPQLKRLRNSSVAR